MEGEVDGVATPCSVGTPASHRRATPATFVVIRGAASASSCPAGTFSSSVGQVACTLAPLGFVVDLEGAVAARPVPLGTYVDAVVP